MRTMIMAVLALVAVGVEAQPMPGQGMMVRCPVCRGARFTGRTGLGHNNVCQRCMGEGVVPADLPPPQPVVQMPPPAPNVRKVEPQPRRQAEVAPRKDSPKVRKGAPQQRRQAEVAPRKDEPKDRKGRERR